MKKTMFHLVCLLIIALLVNGCLTVEKKEYTFELTGENSGKLTIKYINIMSIKDDTLDVSEEDFNELITSYIDGEQIEENYKGATVINKRLFEENGVLCGEVIIEFNDLAGVKLYQYDNKSPFMLNISNTLDTEAHEKSNGEYGGEIMPVIFWSNKLKKLNLTTIITKPDNTTISLLNKYYNWK